MTETTACCPGKDSAQRVPPGGGGADKGHGLRLLARIDRVVLATVVLVAVLAVTAPEQAAASLAFLGASLLEIAPFLLLSVALAAYAKAAGADQQIARAFTGHPVRMVAVAALFGALSPFCSCGVVPVIAALLVAGVPLAPVMAFWLASPIMAPDMFVITAAELGLHFAVGKTMAAFGLGIFGGLATHWLVRREMIAAPLRPGVGPSRCGAKRAVHAERPVWAFWRERERRSAFAANAGQTGWFLLRWLSLAFLVESLMLAYVPPEMVGEWLRGSPYAIPLGVLAGIPAYLNGYAAVPLMGGLVGMGLPPGAAMAFMVGGGVTSIPAAMAVFALVRLPVFAWYLGLAVVGSLFAGYAYQLAV